MNKQNLLYLLRPEITESDIYTISEEEKKAKPLQDKEMLKSHANDTEFNDTTTSSESNGGSSNLSKWIHKIKLEFNIPIATNHSIALFQLLY